MTRSIPCRLEVQYAPFAGAVQDSNGITALLFRHDCNAVTADGQFVMIDRPDEWPDQLYPSWHALPLGSLKPEQMNAACFLLEVILDLPKGTLSADNLAQSLKVAAACCNGTLMQLQQRLSPWAGPAAHDP